MKTPLELAEYVLRLLRGELDYDDEPQITTEPILWPPRMMQLVLDPLPEVFKLRGTYGDSGNYLAERMRFGHPKLVQALSAREKAYPGAFHMSDVYRDLKGSLRAVQSKAGSLPPGYSTHNAGLACDDDTFGNRGRLRDVGITEMGRKGWKRELDELNSSFGLQCLRTDHRLELEHWHHGVGLLPHYEGERTFYAAGQWQLVGMFAEYWRHMDWWQIQTALQVQEFYDYEIDGIPGPKTRAGIRAFQTHWNMGRFKNKKRRAVPGRANEATRRLLAFASAERVSSQANGTIDSF